MDKVTLLIIFLVIGFAIALVTFLGRGNPQNNSSTLTTFAAPSITPTAAPLLDEASSDATVAGTESANLSRATISTSKGDIVIELYPDDAPKTVTNFADKSSSDYYNDLTFHRVEDWVVQGGDPLGNGTGGGNIDTELNDRPFVRGSVGVARGGNIQISNDSQFFITKTDADWLNNQYTNFGTVVEGMDVVDSMEVGDTIESITLEEAE